MGSIYIFRFLNRRKLGGEEFWKKEINREICKIEKLKVCFK